MKAKELHEHFKSVGRWVNWERTVDRFLAGNPDVEVEGIAVSWMPTFPNLENALKAGCNLFVTHEPLYAVTIDDQGKVIGGTPFIDPHLRGIRKKIFDKNDVWVKKQKWLEEVGMTVYRCHDFWDDFPEMGIEIHEFDETTVEDLANRILERVKPLGQEAVHVVGNLRKRVSRIAIGTGAITDYREMHRMGADVGRGFGNLGSGPSILVRR